MSKEEIQKQIEELQKNLKGMDIPEYRKTSLPWLLRNLGVRNSTHPNFPKAMETIKQLHKAGVRI